MARHVLTTEERRRGANNVPREAKVRGGKKGFAVTCERYPRMQLHLKYAPGMRRYKEGRFNPK